MTVHLIFCLDVPSRNLSFQLLIKHELDLSSRFYDQWHTGAWLREANDLGKHTCFTLESLLLMPFRVIIGSMIWSNILVEYYSG